MRQLPASEAAPLIACVLGARDVADRMARRHEIERRLHRLHACRSQPRVREHFRADPCPADYGLTAREAGVWGRLRASGLSEQDAADVVKAARREGRS